MKDGKMSKSKGNVIYPEHLIEQYGLDATRYYLLRELSFGQDSTFTPENFIERYNFDLCNDLGNLLNRTIGMMNKYFEGVIPTEFSQKNEPDAELEEFANKQCQLVEQCMDDFHISNSLAEIWNLIARTNKYIDETAPWVLAKEEKNEKLQSVMYHLVENLRKIAILLTPFMPNTAENMLSQLGLQDENLKSWDSLKSYNLIPKGAKVVEKGEPLFMRKDKEEEIEYIKNAMKK